MPLGLHNAAQTFKRFIDQVLKDLPFSMLIQHIIHHNMSDLIITKTYVRGLAVKNVRNLRFNAIPQHHLVNLKKLDTRFANKYIDFVGPFHLLEDMFTY